MTLGNFKIVWAIIADPPGRVEQQLQYIREQLMRFLGFIGHMVVDHPNEFITAVATCVVAAFTIVLALSTKRLWYASQEQSRDMKNSITAAYSAANAANGGNRIAVDNAQRQLRAYVTAQNVNLITHRKPAAAGASVPGTVHTYGVAAILRNGGQTPATNIILNVSFQKLPRNLPEAFDFPDSTFFGHGLIGPNSEMHTPAIHVGADELQAIEADTEWYLWGWVEYDDVFTGTARHRTEFCFQMDRFAILPGTRQFLMGFKHHARFNAADDDCLRPPR